MKLTPVKVKSVVRTQSKERVFDIQTKNNHNFFANDILVHNSAIFQEQIIELAHKVGGFSLDDADKVRKALMKRTMTGKDAAAKKQEELGAKFVVGAMKNGLTESDAQKIWEKMKFFSGYGFCFGHALAYAIDSYMCAWLFTYYPDEWLCAWLESAQSDTDEKSQAIAEVKRYGYKVVPLDINYADIGWTILPDKKLMPSFKSLQGVGEAALEEIKKHRPYKDLTDLLWNQDGTWRHSKANKRVWDVLTKLGCLDSMGLVGEGKLFSNYRQLNYVLTDALPMLKKKNGAANLATVLETAQELEDWTDQEKAKFHQELSGNLDASMLISEEVQQKLLSYGVPDISKLTSGKGLVWFILEKFIQKKTKNGKDYLLLSVIDSTGQGSKVFLWNGRPSSYISENSVYVAEVSKSDFGYSCSMRDLKRLD